MVRAKQWPRDVWLEALWHDETLSVYERAVSYAFARYAGEGDVTWCTTEELRKRTGGTSERHLRRAVHGLRSRGYLREVEKARQHRSPRYQLTVPDSHG